MSSSIIIARLLGPLMLVSAAAILVNRKGIQKATEATVKNTGLIYLDGMLMLLGGLAIVELHNVWTSSWQTLITVVGWLTLVSGAVRMIAPDRVAAMGKNVAGREAALAIGAAVSAVLGLVLTIQGFTT